MSKTKNDGKRTILSELPSFFCLGYHLEAVSAHLLLEIYLSIMFNLLICVKMNKVKYYNLEILWNNMK